jgi:hypothetical protein
MPLFGNSIAAQFPFIFWIHFSGSILLFPAELPHTTHHMWGAAEGWTGTSLAPVVDYTTTKHREIKRTEIRRIV